MSYRVGVIRRLATAGTGWYRIIHNLLSILNFFRSVQHDLATSGIVKHSFFMAW